MSKHRLLIIFACLFTPATILADTPSTVRIGSWNMHWLGRSDRRGNTEQSPEDIAKYIDASKVAILAINEVSFNDGTEALPQNKSLKRAMALLKAKTGDDWEHRLFLRDDPRDVDLLCGVAWNTSKVKLIEKPMRIGIRRSKRWQDIWNRHPYAVKFSTGEGKTDVVVIPVHMKSNFGGVFKTSKQRTQEARTLIRALGQVQNQFSDDDVIILGDFNTRYGSEECLYRYAVTGFKDLNGADQMTWIKDNRYSAAPFDRILVSREQPEVKDCKQVVFKEHHLGTEEKYRKVLSDHYLVYTDVAVQEDDD